MKVKAWLQMGVERRETVIEIPVDEYRAGQQVTEDMEGWLEEYVREWIEHQFGWGWSGGGYEVDLGFLEGSDGAGLCVVADSAIPNTRAVRLGVMQAAPTTPSGE